MASSSLENHSSLKRELIPPLPTPHWGSQSGASFTVRATSIISARPQLVLDALLNTSTWQEWNQFVPRAFLHNPSEDSHDPSRLRAGTLFTEHVDMAGRGRSTIVKMRLLMTALDEIDEPDKKGFRVVWLGKMCPDWALRSERVHDIYEASDGGGTVYNVYETFSGPLAWAVKFFVGSTLVERFGQWNRELGRFVECKIEE